MNVACRLLLLTIVSGFLLTACVTAAPLIAMPYREPAATHLKKLKPRVILVLGSGSARGFAHAGVLKVLEKNHIPIDMIIGTSAGSIVGSLYADYPHAARLQQLLLTTSRNEVIDFSLLHIGSGVISGNQLQQFLVKNMRAKTFEQLRIPFLAVATDLGSGRKHVFASGPIAPAVNASSAVPPFFRPVQLYGRTYVDGALIDPVAVDIAEQFHPQLIIAVNLAAPLSAEIPTNSPSIFLRGIEMMMTQLNQYSAAKAQVIIRPEQGDIGMFDGEKRADLIKAGEKAAYQALPKIKRILAKNKIDQ